MGRRLRAILTGATLAVAQVAAAQAGLRLEIDVSERGTAPAPPERWIVWLDAMRLVAEPARSEGSPPARRAIFQGAQDVAWLVDPAQRSYFQLDPESAQALAARLAGVRNGVAQGLELLSPEQREAAKGILGGLATPPRAPPPTPRLRLRVEQARHAGIACTRNDVLEGERRVAELCLAAWGTGPLTRERTQALPALRSFLRRTLAPLVREVESLRPLAPLAGLPRLEGFPLAARVEDPGRPPREIAVVSVEQRTVDPSLFELPAGYTRSLIPPFE